jgi:translation initiation factor IF-2
MRAISCCCAGDGPGLRRAPARFGPPGGGPGGPGGPEPGRPGGPEPSDPESGGRWPSSGAGGPAAGPALDVGHGVVLGSPDGFVQGEVFDSDGVGQREVPGSAGGAGG